MKRPPSLVVGTLAAAAMLLGALTVAAPAAAAATEPVSPWKPEPIEWSSAGGSAERGVLEVPVDYDDPTGPTFELSIARHPARDPDARIGVMLVNYGGPGFGWTILALAAPQVFGAPLVDHFDIVAWDPRGTGDSQPAIDCIDDYDAYFAGFDITPDTPEERQALVDVAEDFAASCVERNAGYLEYVGTNNAARDMDAIRIALGEDELTYFGKSYGSELGGTWATLFPDTVRAAVLDGASDPNADLLEHSLQQNEGFEAVLATYLAECSAEPGCAFHSDGDAEGAFDDLMLALDEQPIPTEPGRPNLDRGMAIMAVAMAMYDRSYWPRLSFALADARDGDGAGLLALWDDYFDRRPDGTWDNSLEAFQAISCMDAAERRTVEEEDANVELFQAVAPRMAPHTTGSYFCTFFPPSIDPRVDITGAGAGPIVVCGATGDAATPLASTRNMATALEDGRLIVIAYDGHTCYDNDACADEVIEAYLIDLVVPEEQTDCPGVDTKRTDSP